MSAAETVTGFRPHWPTIPKLNLFLFAATCLTTTMAGAYLHGVESPLLHPLGLLSGLSFSVPLMAILLVHEMGHYFTARRYRVDASLPYFIPAPFPSVFLIGTFGAFIKMRSPTQSRKVIFDVGAMGPWAGLALALPVVIVGLKLSSVSPLDSGRGGIELGNSLLFLGLVRWVLGVDPNSVTIDLSSVAFAGWIGLFVTSLNLLPVGQLDGGHVVYALFGRRHRFISGLFVLSCVLMVAVPYMMGWQYWSGWLLWAALLLFLGLRHPPAVDEDIPLDARRRVAAWMTLALFIITFIPVPVSFNSPSQQLEQPEELYEVHEGLPGNAAGTHFALRRVRSRVTAESGGKVDADSSAAITPKPAKVFLTARWLSTPA